jgi:DNA-binding GntR family transcriptional regulator
VHAAAKDLGRVAARRTASWQEVAAAHSRVHEALVAAAGAPRIERAYAALSTELDLFLSQLRPVWTRERLGPDHVALVNDLERDGPDALREHMAAALRALHPDASTRD